MSQQGDYVPPKVWTWTKPNGGTFANINRPTAGSTHEQKLPVGRHPLQLYSLGTPNGVKVAILLEELLQVGHSGAEYDAWLIDINTGEQFGSDFVEINPNSKIPALVDRGGAHPISVFESGSILLYLAEKFGAFLPKELEGAIFPWYGGLAKGWNYGAAEFLATHQYTHVLRWADEIAARPAVQRGRMINRTWGDDPSKQLPERHHASDFQLKTRDKVPATQS
jgi:glutathione S-transferase